MSYTENLADFGYIEREEAGRLLLATLPENFGTEGVRVAFNTLSGYVFLVNDDYQCAMFNDGQLEIFHSTPYQGIEGFISDLLAENLPDDLHQEDAEYILTCAEQERAELPEAWKNFAVEAA
jgi:PAS domain-containing protein